MRGCPNSTGFILQSCDAPHQSREPCKWLEISKCLCCALGCVEKVRGERQAQSSFPGATLTRATTWYLNLNHFFYLSASVLLLWWAWKTNNRIWRPQKPFRVLKYKNNNNINKRSTWAFSKWMMHHCVCGTDTTTPSPPFFWVHFIPVWMYLPSLLLLSPSWARDISLGFEPCKKVRWRSRKTEEKDKHKTWHDTKCTLLLTSLIFVFWSTPTDCQASLQISALSFNCLYLARVVFVMSLNWSKGCFHYPYVMGVLLAYPSEFWLLLWEDDTMQREKNQ